MQLEHNSFIKKRRSLFWDELNADSMQFWLTTSKEELLKILAHFLKAKKVLYFVVLKSSCDNLAGVSFGLNFCTKLKEITAEWSLDEDIDCYYPESCSDSIIIRLGKTKTSVLLIHNTNYLFADPYILYLCKICKKHYEMLEELEQAQALLYYDDLTGLYNYRHLFFALENEIRRANRFNNLFSVLFIDLDNLKVVNDSFGHLHGSELLIQVGTLLKKELREVDTIVRYGGDEFIVILLDAGIAKSKMVAERIRSAISSISYDNNKIHITASIGIATYPIHAKEAKSLIELADKAMYMGKKSGKNKVNVAENLSV